MQALDRAFEDVKSLYEEVVSGPLPELDAARCIPFPAGVDPVTFAVEEVEELKRIIRDSGRRAGLPAWSPRADLLETRTHFVYCVEVPGFESGDLSVQVSDGLLVVRGERKPWLGLPDAHPVSAERPWGPFERRFALPAGTTSEQIDARCESGLLTIRIDRNEAELTRETRVKVA